MVKKQDKSQTTRCFLLLKNIVYFFLFLWPSVLRMNFLAHLYLSGEDDEVKLGNFIGDYVKGSKYLEYAEKIKKGILLHRKIDSFTDSHPLIKEASEAFRLAFCD